MVLREPAGEVHRLGSWSAAALCMAVAAVVATGVLAQIILAPLMEAILLPS